MAALLSEPTKKNLIKMIVQTRAELEALISPLSNAQLTAIADPAGWTLKDHLVHLAVWEGGVAALLRGESRYSAMDMDAYIHLHGDFDALNEVLYTRYKEMDAAEVRRMSREAHEAILAGLDPLTTEDLMQPYNEYQPDKVAEGDTRPVFGLVAGNTIAHYAEHMETMRALIAQTGE